MDDNVTDLTANTVPSGMTWLPPMLPICGGIQAPPMSGRRRTTQCGMSSRAPARSGPRHRQPATRHRPPATARPAAGWPAPLVARGSGDETDGGTWFLLLAMPGRPRGQPMALNRRARTRPGRCRALQPQSRPPTHNPATARPDRAAGPASHEGRGRQGRNGQPSQAIPWLPRTQRPERDAVGNGVFRQHASNRCRHRARSSAACPAHRLPFLAGPRAGTRPSSTGSVAGAGCSARRLRPALPGNSPRTGTRDPGQDSPV